MRGILFDMDGVLYNSDRPIAGAAEAVRRVRQQAVPHLFVTNTTSCNRGELVRKLLGFGIEASAEEILTPAAAAAEWLRNSLRRTRSLVSASSCEARVRWSALPRG
jgi:ribonucleotide monophosphatase NagD (HAD superfamily)